MVKNTGIQFEEEVYEAISKLVKDNDFMVSFPNVKIQKKPKYYSKDRDAEIEFDMSVEKYLDNPNTKKNIRPSIIVIIECKDYSKSIPVDDVEEFHAKLQQIGADNTKGMIITKNGCFQRSALTYAESKGIALARIIPANQIDYAVWCIDYENYESMIKENMKNAIEALTKKEYKSLDKDFYSLAGDEYLGECVCRILGINFLEYLQIKFKINKAELLKSAEETLKNFPWIVENSKQLEFTLELLRNEFK